MFGKRNKGNAWNSAFELYIFLLHAEPRRRSEFWMVALVAVAVDRLGRVCAMGRAAGVEGGARGRRLPALK